MQSLKDKLLKAGLVSDADVKKAEAPKVRVPDSAPEEKLSGHRAPAAVRQPPRAAEPREATSRLPKFSPLQGSAAANREASRKQVQLDRQIRELVLSGTVAIDDGATPFYYATRKNKLRRLLITEPQAQALQAGTIAIVERPDPGQIEHQLVTAECAEALLKLSDKTVRFFNKAGQAVGFLSEEAIAKGASETDASPAAVESPGTTDAPATPAEPAETWVTIKRS